MHQYATIEDTIYLGFASNLTSGAADDGATPLFDVRLGGGAAGDAPILSGTPTLLTHANYSPGCYEVAVAATAANGFAAGNTYLVFVTLTIDSVTPASMVGSFTLGPVPANATQLSGDETAANNAEAFFDGTGYAGTNNVIPTVTNLTNAPTAGDLTATMKTSVTTAATTATPSVDVNSINGVTITGDGSGTPFNV